MSVTLPKDTRCILGGLSRLPCTRRRCEWWNRRQGKCKWLIKAEKMELTNAENRDKTS